MLGILVTTLLSNKPREEYTSISTSRSRRMKMNFMKDYVVHAITVVIILMVAYALMVTPASSMEQVSFPAQCFSKKEYDDIQSSVYREDVIFLGVSAGGDSRLMLTHHTVSRTYTITVVMANDTGRMCIINFGTGETVNIPYQDTVGTTIDEYAR